MTEISSTHGADLAALHMGQRGQSADDTIAALARAANGPEGFNVESARQVAEEFEGTFISALVDTMFSGIETDGPFGGGQAEGMFRSMLNQEYAKVMTGSGGLGLADNILDSIIRLQTGGSLDDHTRATTEVPEVDRAQEVDGE